MSVLKHTDLDFETRGLFLKASNSIKRGEKQNFINEDLYEKISSAEQFILTVAKNGYGKRTSAYEYRITNRGGQGIINIETSERNGTVVDSFPVTDEEQIILVTDAGRIIRSPVNDIRIASRNTQGVTLFNINKGESVVSITRLSIEDTTEPEEEVDSENKENNQEENMTNE